MSRPWRQALLLSLALLGACSHVSRQERAQALDYAERARDTTVACAADCSIDSPLRQLGPDALAASTPTQPRHGVLMLDGNQHSLLARVHLIRAARHSVDLQTFHFARDDAGHVMLDALRDAARRGVKVRLLMDQLNGLADPELQARLAGFHRNFELRVYNPVFEQASVNPLEFVGGILFRFRDLNRRMHNKMMLVDDSVAIIGGRNVQDEYFGWNDSYNYRDRDLLVAGPATRAMKANFDAFWSDPRALPPTRLADVARVLLEHRGPPDGEAPARAARVVAMARAAEDGAAVFETLRPHLYEVGPVSFHGDLPSKHGAGAQSRIDASAALMGALGGAREELLLQTPYLVMSRQARQLFRRLQQRTPPLPVIVSTNSLAATDAFPVYAMSHKYKRLYLRELGFQIHEYKPFPGDLPDDRIPALAPPPAVPGDIGEAAAPDLPAPGNAARRLADERARASHRVDPSSHAGHRHRTVPLTRPGVRIGLHSKSMVVDNRIAIVGSHNFDPRSNDFNTESLVMVHDPVFAVALAESIRRDISPANSWVVAPREKLPVLWGLNYNLGKLSEKLPIFDVWPLPYATSYDLRPGCAPVPANDPRFRDCYEAVGDFPEVNLSLKMIYTRVLTVFGAGLIPIL